MPTYTYKAKKTTGEIIEGSLEAENRRLVIARLQKMQAYPIRVEMEGRAGGLGAFQKEISIHSFRRISRREICAFTRQMSDLLKSGLTLVRALDVLVQQTENERFKEIIKNLRSEVQGGSTFSAALAKHPKVFPDLYSSMVHAGEVGGLLDEVMDRLAEFNEAELETRNKIISALAYPAIMVVVGAGVIVVLMTFVIPRFNQMFSEIGADLPKITLLLVALSEFVTSYYALIVAGAIVALIVAYLQLLKQPEERLRIDRIRLKVPVYGSFVLKNEVARFARTLGTLLGNGVPILRALEITKTMIKNQAIATVMGDIAENVKEGERLSTRLTKSRVFPPVAVNMVVIGEETGSLETTLLRVASTYEKETERQLRTLTTLVEPLMILVMGAVVGFIVMAMVLPIFQLSAAIQ